MKACIVGQFSQDGQRPIPGKKPIPLQISSFPAMCGVPRAFQSQICWNLKTLYFSIASCLEMAEPLCLKISSKIQSDTDTWHGKFQSK